MPIFFFLFIVGCGGFYLCVLRLFFHHFLNGLIVFLRFSVPFAVRLLLLLIYGCIRVNNADRSKLRNYIITQTTNEEKRGRAHCLNRNMSILCVLLYPLQLFVL